MPSTACGHLHFCHGLAGIIPNMVLGALRELHANDLREGSAWPCCWTKLRHLSQGSLGPQTDIPCSHPQPVSLFIRTVTTAEVAVGNQMSLDRGLRLP